MLWNKAQVILTVTALVGVLAIVSIGCSDAGDGKPNPKNITEKNLCEEFAKVDCHNMWNCCTSMDIEMIFGWEQSSSTLPDDEAECREDMKRSCEYNMAPIFQAVADGKASIDSEKITACLKAVVLPDVNSCYVVATDTSFRKTIEDNCTDNSLLDGFRLLVVFRMYSYPWLTGLVPAGGDCANTFECVAGTSCMKLGYADVGKCIANSTSGDACTSNTSNCVDDLYCAYNSVVPSLTDRYCTSSISGQCSCAALKAADITCCDSRECAEGLFCDIPNTVADCSLTGDSGTCKAKKGLGESCYSNTDSSLTSACDDYLSCEVGVCSNDTKISCTQDSDCETGTCNGRVCALSYNESTNYCYLGIGLLFREARVD